MQRPLHSGYRVSSPVGGPACERLERWLEEHYQVPHARVFNSATSALHAAVVATMWDGWTVPCYSMSASAAAVIHAGMTPQFVDIGDDYCAIDPGSFPLLMVHLFGHHAKASDNAVIHDCAQSPSVRPSQKDFADSIWVYSLNQWKICSSGEGGYALTFSKDLADRLHAVRNHGECYTDDILGWNYRMTEPVAEVALAEIKQLDDRLARRREWVENFVRVHDLSGMVRMDNTDWFLIPIRTRPEKREDLARLVGGRVGYHKLIPDLPYFKAHGYGGDFPKARQIESELVVVNPLDFGY